MDNEKTLLQQIREKEQEFAQKLDATRSEAQSIVASAQTDAGDMLCSADETAKKTSEQIYWNIQGITSLEIERLNADAEKDRVDIVARGERNLSSAVEKIVYYVTEG